MPAAEITGGAEKTRRLEEHARRALHQRLEDEGGQGRRVLGQGVGEGVDAWRDSQRPEQERVKDLMEEIDTPGAHRADGVAVIGLGERQELLLFRTASLAPVLEGHLEGDLGRGRSAVREEDLRQPGGGDTDQSFGELDGRDVAQAKQGRVRDAVELGTDGGVDLVVDATAELAVQQQLELLKKKLNKQ